MTALLYQTDSYLREFDTTVVVVDAEKGRVALDRTASTPAAADSRTTWARLRSAARRCR